MDRNTRTLLEAIERYGAARELRGHRRGRGAGRLAREAHATAHEALCEIHRLLDLPVPKFPPYPRSIDML
jgi:hypothetical protein